MNKRGQLWLLLLAFRVVLGCSDSPKDSRDAGPHRDAATRAEDDGGTGVPAHPDASVADSGPGDASAGLERDSGAPDPCAGDVVLEADDDVAAIAECTRISGSLTLTGEGLTTVELPLLETVDGNLAVMASGLESVELPALGFVGQDLRVFGNKRLVRIALPLLATTIRSVLVGEDPSPDGQPMLTSIELPSLSQIGAGYGALRIFGNRALSSLQLPVLELAGDIAIDANPALTELDLPALSVVHGVLVIEDDDALKAVRMPSLVEQDGGYLHLTGKALVSVDLSALRSTGGLLIASDADLHEIDLPELESVDRLDLGPTTATRIVLPKLASAYSVILVSENPLLTSLELPALSRVGRGWAGPRDSDGWGVFLEDNPQLTNVELPALQVVGENLSVQRDPMLSSLTLTSLQEVLGSLLLRDSALVDFSAPVLAKVGGYGNMGGNQVWRWGDLTIADNALLQSIALPLLGTVAGSVQITNNASLPTCDAQALGAQLSDHPELPPKIVIDGNAGSCP